MLYIYFILFIRMIIELLNFKKKVNCLIDKNGIFIIIVL